MLTSAKDALKSGEVSRIKPAIDEVTKASHKLAELLYKRTTEASAGAQQQQQQEQRAGAGGARGGNDDVVDVEFEDVKK